MNQLWLASLVVLLGCVPAFAQLADAGPETQAKCAKYLQIPLPAEAQSVPAPKAWPECASYKSYAGIGTPVNFEAARKCAWSERLAIHAELEPRYSTASVFGGSAMLTQLYANGEGVPQNLPLAIRFACEAEGAPGEIGGRLEGLEKRLHHENKEDSRFQFCDDITSGFMMGFCTAYTSEIEDQNRATATTAISRDWTAAQKSAFQLLLSAKEKYAEQHAKGEVDLSGTARAMFEIEEENGIRDNFLAAVKSFEKGALPKASLTEATEADAQLNRAYRKMMADAEAHKSDYGAIQPEGIRNAERAWLKYRDAWLTFAKARYPGVSDSAWLKLLSDDRVLVLQGKCCGQDPDASEDAVSYPRPLP